MYHLLIVYQSNSANSLIFKVSLIYLYGPMYHRYGKSLVYQIHAKIRINISAHSMRFFSQLELDRSVPEFEVEVGV